MDSILQEEVQGTTAHFSMPVASEEQSALLHHVPSLGEPSKEAEIQVALGVRKGGQGNPPNIKVPNTD